MKQRCDYCGNEFDSDDSINCPNCGSCSTRVIKQDESFDIE